MAPIHSYERSWDEIGMETNHEEENARPESEEMTAFCLLIWLKYSETMHQYLSFMIK